MRTLVKAAVLTIASLSAVLPSMTPAHADDWRYRRHHHRGNDGLALGAVGLATGLIVGGAIASAPRYRNEERVYIDPPADDYYEPAPVYRRPRPVVVNNYGSLEPWSPSWYRYCSNRYRSFDSRTGTFVGYDGRSYFCNAG
ncbi:BA14K family protein [Rhizobium sp. NFR03]|uniref:BA14K family protein n=1 Tax=Rhizobium sp. NFR03 TaxID=1566263 RepID=UPI0008AB7763|nr:BA14K family protein [Rhizobium sp. NFR03]SER59781.1 BA14K-like protein [Rhizobium sp. NFR03]